MVGKKKDNEDKLYELHSVIIPEEMNLYDFEGYTDLTYKEAKQKLKEIKEKIKKNEVEIIDDDLINWGAIKYVEIQEQ